MAEHATLTTDTATAESAVAAMDAALADFGRTTLDDLLSQQETLLAEAKEASELDDTAEAAARMQIINARLEKLAEELPKYREDTAELIAGLEATLTKMGVQINNLDKPTAADTGLIQAAQVKLDALQPALDKAKAAKDAEIKELEDGWFVRNKDARIAALQQDKASLDTKYEADLKMAERAVEEAKAQVERNRRARIRDAQFDAQFDRFIAIAAQIQDALLKNVKNSEARMVKTRQELAAAMEQKEKLSRQIADLAETIAGKEEALLTIEGQIASAIEQADRDALESKRSAAVQELSDLQGKRQEMEVVRNSLDTAATKHQTMLDAIVVQRDNQRSHAMKLAADSRARFEQAKNLVIIIQNTAQEDAASRLHEVGSGLDRMSVEVAAKALIASEQARLRLLKGHEEDKAKLAEITEALAEGRAGIAIEDAEIRARARENFGLDIGDSSWLQIAQRVAGQDAEAA